MSNLVEIRDLNIRFTGERTVYAVNDPSLTLGEGEVLGLLGESGSGKSVTLRALMRLLPKKRTQITGTVNVMGKDVLALDDDELSAFRGQSVSMIFQEPALALDPVYTIGQQIAESDVGNSLDAEAVIQRITKFTRPINYLGLPSLSIPTGFTAKGLPVGMQLIGRAFDEAGLVRIGAAFQRATDYHQKVPKVE